MLKKRPLLHVLDYPEIPLPGLGWFIMSPYSWVPNAAIISTLFPALEKWWHSVCVDGYSAKTRSIPSPIVFIYSMFSSVVSPPPLPPFHSPLSAPNRHRGATAAATHPTWPPGSIHPEPLHRPLRLSPNNLPSPRSAEDERKFDCKLRDEDCMAWGHRRGLPFISSGGRFGEEPRRLAII